MSVINKFVIANVRWRVDAEFELHDMTSVPAREHPASILWFRSREIHACEFADFVIANLASDIVFCHSLKLSKEVVCFTEAIDSVGKV